MNEERKSLMGKIDEKMEVYGIHALYRILFVQQSNKNR